MTENQTPIYTVGNESQFYLPSTMVQYGNFGSFLKEQPVLRSKEEIYMAQLLGCNPSAGGLNLNMFTIKRTPVFQSWKVPETWESIFNSETGIYELQQVYMKLQNIASQGYTIYPLEHEIFRAFELCPRHKLKVVILGQDPYPSFEDALGRPMGNGLSFSGNKGGKKPGSLANVFTEIKRTFPNIQLNHYDLESWARQGVLLLNTCLTVNHGDPESHIKEKIWKYFIEYVIKTISDENPGVIFLLWGAKAKAYANGSTSVISRNKSIVLEAGHPSNLNSSAGTKFAENNHFAYVYYYINEQNRVIWEKNQKLQLEGKELLPYKDQIDWSLP